MSLPPLRAIVAAEAGETVVAGAAEEHVVLGAAVEEVVAAARSARSRAAVCPPY